jgi:hypothetical protein
MDATVERLITAIEADMSAMAAAALALEKHRELQERDDLYARIRADAQLLREVRA